MRWRQDRHTGEFIPVDDAARRDSGQIIIKGNFEPFKSPIDGSVVASQRDMDNHNARNGVVDAREYPPEYYAEKAKERARAHTGERTPAEVKKSRMEIWETINRLERM